MSTRFYPWALLGPLGLLVGCASSAPLVKDPAPAGHEVVGSASADDRTIINNDDERIYKAEHAESPDAPAAPSGSDPGIP